MRFICLLLMLLLTGVGCLKADVSTYQPPCTITDDCPFDWTCMERRCIAPDTPEEDRPKPEPSDGTPEEPPSDAGNSDGSTDGAQNDAGSVDGNTDGAELDAGSLDGSTDGDSADAGGAFTCEDLNCGSNSACDPDSIECVCIEHYHLDNSGDCVVNDYDEDGIGDETDNDDDNDGVVDGLDDCPRGNKDWTSTATNDHDSDGCKDNVEDLDNDNDLVMDQHHTYFSRDYQLIAAGPLGLCGLHNAGMVHCLDAENGSNDAEDGSNDVRSPPYELYNFDQIDVGIGPHYVGLTGTSVSCSQDAHCADEPMTQVSTGSMAACGVPVEGEGIRCWRFDASNNDPIVTSAPTSSNYQYVSVGEQMACGLKDDNEVICWGDISATNGTMVNIQPPMRTETLSYQFSQIDVGDDFACGLTIGSEVKCWPEQNIPDSNAGENNVPDGNFQDLTVGASHFCLRAMGGNTVSCQGLPGLDPADGNDYYPAPVNFPLAQLVSGPRFSCGLRPNTGAVLCWGLGLRQLNWNELNGNDNNSPFVMPADNCPYVQNPNQADSDGDGQGDACEICEEGLFFSVYIAAEQAEYFVTDSESGALSIYNPTTENIDITDWRIANSNFPVDSEIILSTEMLLGEVSIGSLTIPAGESLVLCDHGDPDSVDSACDLLLDPENAVFSSNWIALKAPNGNVIDKIGPSTAAGMNNGSGIYTESIPQENMSSSFRYLQRNAEVTHGQVTFDASEWTQKNIGDAGYSLETLGVDADYSGCSN